MSGSGVARTACGSRLVQSTVAIALAACGSYVTVDDAKAASRSDREFAVVRFSPVASDTTDAPSTSFASRFEYAQASLRRGVMDRLIYRVPMLPIDFASAVRQQDIVPAGPAIVGTASTYNPNEPGDPDSGNSETASG